MRLTACTVLISVFWFSTVARAQEAPALAETAAETVAVPQATSTAQPCTCRGGEPRATCDCASSAISAETCASTGCKRCAAPIPAAVPPISIAEKIAHLRKAATHLAAAGKAVQAHQAIQEAEQLRKQEKKQEIAERALKQKLAELERLQAEVDTLRSASGQSDQIVIHFQVVQVSVAKMREAGLDFPTRDSDSGRAVFPSLFSSKAEDGQPQQSVTIHAGEHKAVAGFVEALRQQHLLKILAEPTLVAVDKRPVSFAGGGEFPVPVPQSEGTVSIQFRQFGTQVEFVPTLLGNNQVRLAMHSRFAEMDPTLNVTVGGLTVPGLRTVALDSDEFVAQLGETTVLGEMTQLDAKSLGDEAKQASRSVDEIRTFFLVTPELFTPQMAKAAPPCNCQESAAAPSSTRLR